MAVDGLLSIISRQDRQLTSISIDRGRCHLEYAAALEQAVMVW